MKLIHGNCVEALQSFSENSLHACVTDPPFELNFMNKKWDNSGVSFDPKTWQAVLRVLKPGAHMLVFGGTRTYHRMACAIEDAGFEIRDCLMWIFGCLSEDTEILVDGKWEHYSKAIKGRNALCYEVEHGNFSWKPIQDHVIYYYNDTAFRITSDFTDQIVSRNHRCLVEQEGKYVFLLAEEAARKREIRIPVVEDLSSLLYDLSLRNQGEGCSPSKPQLPRQSFDKFGIIQKQSGSQTVRSSRYTKTSLANIRPIYYNGIVWCIRVPTGAFVARRNGKVFITGNSGFPKSLDVGKAIDKMKGLEREVSGQKFTNVGMQGGNFANKSRQGQIDLHDIPASPEAKRWDGYGTSLKPAYESIVLARKPLDGTVANNVLLHGCGGININGCRIPTQGKDAEKHKAEWDRIQSKNAENNKVGKMGLKDIDLSQYAKDGRWPANVILDEEAGRILDEQADSVSRFFYCSKASKKDRDEGNGHPTVKPTSLMRYLVRLISPPSGSVLDPFMGSGSTGVACILEDISNFAGIDINQEYVDIAKKRIAREVLRLANRRELF